MTDRIETMNEFAPARCLHVPGLAVGGAPILKIVSLADARREEERLTALSFGCVAMVGVMVVMLLTAVFCLGGGQGAPADLGLAGIDQAVVG